MRRIIVVLGALVVLTGCEKEAPKGPVEQLLSIGVQAEKELAETSAKKASATDAAEAVELGKQEVAIVDSAKARMLVLLGGKGKRLPLPVGASEDSLPVSFGGASIGLPDFFKGEFRINLAISGVGKRPLPESAEFQLVALDSAGLVLASKDASMVDSLRMGDSLYAGANFRGAEILRMRSLAAR
ncbi:MAG: lipoprotein [Fibrobacteria bacterium]|nr:lipoprotein [Fibrobacteria bacterium]